MAITKRIFLFLAVNLLIVFSISIVLSVLGVQPYLTSKGIDYSSLIIFCLIWGFGGAFISLSLSRVIAKWMMGVRIINPDSTSPEERWLLDRVSRISNQAGLPKVPEVGIYESPDSNAFATGPMKSRALVAVSTGILQRMSRDELEGVLAHEIAHIANGDMVTMTLVQGVVNAFVMFFARILAWFASQFFDEDKRGLINFISVILFDLMFSLLGMMVVASFSRRREFRADGGGAMLVGRAKMLAALRSLQNTAASDESSPKAIASLKISSERKSGFLALISTHPPLEDRIKRLENFTS